MQKIVYLLGAGALFLVAGGVTAPFISNPTWNTVNITLLSLAIVCVSAVIGILLEMLVQSRKDKNEHSTRS
jgi:hypothetical protein